MDDAALLSAIKANKLFSSLDEESCQSLLPKLKPVELNEGEILFEQGAPSDCVYLLVSGKLSASLRDAQGNLTVIGRLEPGKMIGDVSALSGEPRTLTTTAMKPCLLLKLPSHDFVELCYHRPAIMFAAIHPIISRTESIIHSLSPEKSDKHILIIPANKSTSLAPFAEQLAKITHRSHNIVLISDYDPYFGDSNNDLSVLREKISLTSKQKKAGHRILYLLKSYETPLAKISLKRADKVYVVANNNSIQEIDPFIIDKINRTSLHINSDPELVILHAEGRAAPRNTANWLKKMTFAFHHHVRIDMIRDYQRLLRFMREKAVGIVLSGGGTRGWSHIGALKALREARIPIDIIGGTSVGAIIAACYAIQESCEDAYEKFYNIIRQSQHSVSWRSLTWPAISLFNAKNFTLSQMDAFENIQIEDLWLPYFCVSCNLATNTEEIHRKGLLWEKTRASASIPGIIPPMVIDGALHLDGGLLNNLPVDVMRDYVGKKGRVIGIELNNFSSDRHKYQFPPVLTFKQTVFAKLGMGEEVYKFPRFIETFLRGLFVGSLAKSRQNSLGANMIVNLNLTKFRLLHANTKQAERMIEIGYKETLSQLHEIKKHE